jgi:hypothetical protein
MRASVHPQLCRALPVLEVDECRTELLDDGTQLARWRWRIVPFVTGSRGCRAEWSNGGEHLWLWREGVQPEYSPMLTEPEVDTCSHPYLAAIIDTCNSYIGKFKFFSDLYPKSELLGYTARKLCAFFVIT